MVCAALLILTVSADTATKQVVHTCVDIPNVLCTVLDELITDVLPEYGNPDLL